MDELRILQLLETTDPKKLAQLERVTRFTPTGAQSANEMLNDELFGTSVGSKRRAAKESAQGNNSSVRRSNPLTRTAQKRVAGAKESAGFRRANGYRSTEEPVKGAKECVKAPVDESDGGSIFDEPADEKKTPKKRMNVGEGEGCEDGACGADECNAGESVVETGDSKFPEEFDFDAEAFAEEYSIDPETITCVFVEEDQDAKIAEHVELSFTYEESTVILSIYADSTVTETVDAEEVDAQFSANFAEEEDEDGNKRTVLHVDLIDGEGAEDATAEDAPVDDTTADEDIDDGAAPNEGDDEPDEAAMYKSIIRKLTEVPDVPEAADELREELESSGLTEEEMNAVYAIRDEAPDVVMSEGDADHKGEDGGNVTDEFIEEHGLDLDPVYSKDHGIKVAKGMDAGTMPGYRKEDKGATESLAAKIIRTSK